MAEAAWRITGQVTDQVVNTQAGATVTGTIVYYVTGEGNEGSVFVANQHYNVKNVRKAVHESAALLDEVGRLTHGNLAGE